MISQNIASNLQPATGHQSHDPERVTVRELTWGETKPGKLKGDP